MAVLFVDLDNLKTVNDSLGHTAGDELLQVVASRLETALRPEDTAARLGGDEFAVLIDELAGEAEALHLAERIRRALEPPLAIGERIVTVTASIGVACPDGTATAEDLLRDADVAMYAAKERGKGQVAMFEPLMHARVVERVELNRDLDTALDNGELTLVFQPLVDLDSGAMVGVEALLRWNHPRRGLIVPDRCIALAESSGLIRSGAGPCAARASNCAAGRPRNGQPLASRCSSTCRRANSRTRGSRRTCARWSRRPAWWRTV